MGPQTWALGVQRQRRRARPQMSLGVCHACGIRLMPDICRLSPLPLPVNGPTQNHGNFNLEIFFPGCATFALTVDSSLLLSLISLVMQVHKGWHLKWINSILHQSTWKIVLRGFHPLPNIRKKWLKSYKQIFEKEQVFFLNTKLYNRCFWEVVNFSSIVRNSVTPHTASIVKQLTYWWAFTFIYLDGKICLLNLSTNQHEEVQVQSKFD